MAVPIYQTTAYAFEDVDHAAKLFSLEGRETFMPGIMSPTDVLEKRIAAAEAGLGISLFFRHGCHNCGCAKYFKRATKSLLLALYMVVLIIYLITPSQNSHQNKFCKPDNWITLKCNKRKPSLFISKQ